MSNAPAKSIENHPNTLDFQKQAALLLQSGGEIGETEHSACMNGPSLPLKITWKLKEQEGVITGGIDFSQNFGGGDAADQWERYANLRMPSGKLDVAYSMGRDNPDNWGLSLARLKDAIKRIGAKGTVNEDRVASMTGDARVEVQKKIK
ncbi:MAG: hypothetical protein ABL890_02270 [Candidatus Peribacteraceae bacterium]